jgi:NADH:ubiquinone oxidoreductase subunit 3 (subunit A)
MASDYLAVLVFIIFSLLFPASLLLFSRLIRMQGDGNSVSTLNFESAEESRGSRLTLMREYFHYFSAFLAFEVISAVILVWVVTAKTLPPEINMAILGFAVFGFAFEAFAMLIAVKKE